MLFRPRYSMTTRSKPGFDAFQMNKYENMCIYVNVRTPKTSLSTYATASVRRTMSFVNHEVSFYSCGQKYNMRNLKTALSKHRALLRLLHLNSQSGSSLPAVSERVDVGLDFFDVDGVMLSALDEKLGIVDALGTRQDLLATDKHVVRVGEFLHSVQQKQQSQHFASYRHAQLFRYVFIYTVLFGSGMV